MDQVTYQFLWCPVCPARPGPLKGARAGRDDTDAPEVSRFGQNGQNGTRRELGFSHGEKALALARRRGVCLMPLATQVEGVSRVAGHRSVGLGVRPLMRNTAITGLAGKVLPQVEITTYGATPLACRSGEHM